ncbi:MAG: integral rane sensor signal transduction histidine kinase [Solirubrobacterales bacterium]|nr:integral rane sensor signal transduction histidine kinase [Solirubrobacterales bacterium]
MSFRRRIAIASASAVAVAVLLASLLVYLLTSQQLRSQVDSQLRSRGRNAQQVLRFLGAAQPQRVGLAARSVPQGPAELPAPAGGAVTSRGTPRLEPFSLSGKLPPNPGQVRGYQQVLTSDGSIVARSAPGVTLPIDARTRRLSKAGGASFFRDAQVHGIHLRLLAEPLSGGRVLQLAQPLTEVDSLLGRLRLILLLLGAGGIALAALLGRIVAGAAVRPLKRLTETTEHVAVTQDLSQRIEPAGVDELGRLAGSFNAMLDALEGSMSALDASVHAQRQLVADASHELRTPVTSLRTNIEILQRQGGEVDPQERARLLADIVEQIEELTLLVNDLIDLARGEEPRLDTEELRLDLLVHEVAARARRRSTDSRLSLELEPTIVKGVPDRLERAVGNLIDNAIKYSDKGAPLEVGLRAGELTVRDHGPGISSVDLPHIFDRFYRGADARGRPGSGLGLAIVRQVAGQHGGTIVAEQAAGGGTLMRLRLPYEAPPAPNDRHIGAGHELVSATAGKP